MQDPDLAEAVQMANIPTLLPVLYQLTGDEVWLSARYAPTRPRGNDDHDTGGLSEKVRAEIHAAAVPAIRAHLDGVPVAVPRPADAMLERMLSFSMAEPVPEGYGGIIAAGMGLPPEGEAEHAATPPPPGFKVVIIGGGLSGIIAGVRLGEAGIDFEIIERNPAFGGTWYGNRYPGCGVDTPNHLYSFSFAPNDWPHYFARRADICAYLQDTARSFGLAAHTRFNTKVDSLAYDTDAHCWQVTATGPDGARLHLRADAVISAVGVLDVPKIPPIPGLQDFPGPAFHSARWPAGLDVTGKRVAVVGNGASAMQIVPEIASSVRALTIFARSKQWAAPHPKLHVPVPQPVRQLLQAVPLYQKWYRQRLGWTWNDKIHPTIQVDPDWPDQARSLNATNAAHRRFFEDYIRAELGERQDLLKAVLPEYPPFAKRMLLDHGWFRTLTQDHVTLVPDHLERVEGNRLIGADGSAHEADILVLATGFRAADFLSTLDVTGPDGQLLRDAWGGDDARAYLGTAIPGFPNLFTLLGPNIGLGHGGSIITPVELQMDYLMSLLQQMFARNARAVDVRRDVHDRYNRAVDEAHSRMVFAHEGTSSWYRNSQGRIVAITPWRFDQFWRMTRRADLDDYALLGQPERPAHNAMPG